MHPLQKLNERAVPYDMLRLIKDKEQYEKSISQLLSENGF